MGLQVQNARELTVPYSHWWIYGSTGAGKTTAAATFPVPLFLVPQNEQSITTLAGMDVDYITINGLDGGQIVKGLGSMKAAITEIVRLYNQALPLLNSEDEEKQLRGEKLFPWQTVVCESMTHYIDMALLDIQKKIRPGDNFAQWRLLGEHLNWIQVSLRSIDVHVVFTSLAEISKTDTQVLKGQPLVQSKARDKMPSACDVIAYMEHKGNKRLVHLEKSGPWDARSRFPQLPKHIEDFNFERDLEVLLAPQVAQ